LWSLVALMVLSKVATAFAPFVIRDVLHGALQIACSDLYTRAKHDPFLLRWAGTTPMGHFGHAVVGKKGVVPAQFGVLPASKFFVAHCATSSRDFS